MAVVRGALVLLTLCAVTGCAPAWKRLTPIPAALTPDRNQRLQVWTHGENVHYWYGVVITPDSVTGLPYDTRGDVGRGAPRLFHRDTTRRGVALTDVDSIRLGSYNPANWYLIAADLTLNVVYTVVSKCHGILFSACPSSTRRP